ncbi:MAG: 50S ribosomal protein L19e [Candidatus Micrarchaeota archaeon]
MGQKTIKRLAASILGIGECKIWLSPTEGKKISEALTRDDVRTLIKDGVIKALPRRGVSRYRARLKEEAKRAGRRRGRGSRKGTKRARRNPKEFWMAKVRSQRKRLFSLVEKGELEKKDAKKVYLKIKGNSFKGKQQLVNYLKENNMLKETKK